MGFNTSLMLCNDQVHTLVDDKKLGEAIHDMVMDLSAPLHHRRHQYGYRGVKVINTQHADYDQIVRVGRNNGALIGQGITLNPLLDAAIALSQTKDPAERRRLIRCIENNARVHKDCMPREEAEKG